MNLDAWLSDPLIRSRHRRRCAAAPSDLWAAAQAVRLGDTQRVGRLVRWRIPGTPADTTFRELFRNPPFLLLDEGEHWSVSGLVGRIWTLEVDYPRLEDAGEFVAWDRPGTAKVLFAHWVADGALWSEARVAGTDRAARLRLRALWALVGGFERLIGGDALRVAVSRAGR